MKKRKLLPISLLCLASMILVGCGGGKKSSTVTPSSESPVSQPASVPASEPASVPASVPASQPASTPASQPKPSSVPTSQPQPSSQPQPTSQPQPSSQPASSVQQDVAVTGISLDQQAITLLLGASRTLVATVAPENATNKEVVWSSEDTDVATVNQQGVVSAVEIGQTTIKAKAKGTNFVAECVVTVEKEIQSIAIKNKASFAEFLVDDLETLNVEVTPEDNVAALLAAGALKVTSSVPSVATANGLNIAGVSAGKTTIKVELFGKSDEFELTVSDPQPGVKSTIADAFATAITEAPCNGKTGRSAAISTTCFEFSCAKVLAVAPDYDSSTRQYSDTAFIVLIDDGTAALYLLVGKKDIEPIPVQVGDYVKVTCRLTNYFGLFEGVWRNAKTNESGSYVKYKDFIKVDAPETPITASIEQAVPMTGDEYKAYYDLCKTNSGASANAYTLVKHVSIQAKFDAARNETDKGGYIIYDDADNAKDLGLQNVGLYQMDDGPDGSISTLDAYLIGANTSKNKSNAFVLEQTPLAPTAVAIDQEADTIVVHGNTLQMSYTTTPAGSYCRQVAWTSSDLEAATIDEKGLLTGVYVGTGFKPTNVKVVLGEGESAIESVPVSIKVFGEEVPAEAAQLDKTEATILLGQKLTLTATTTPAMVSDIAVWSSSDETVAKVDQKGVITSLKEGTAVITVKFNETVSASCNITVRAQKLSDLAHAKYGDEVDVYGIVSGKYPVDGRQGLWLADGQYGIYLNHAPKEGMDKDAIVHVVGTIDSYNGSKQIKATSYDVVESYEGLAAPVALNLDEAAIAAIDETTQGRFCTVSGVVTAHSGSGDSAHHTITLKVGEKSIKVYVHKDNCGKTITGGFDAAAVGKLISVTGFMSCYQSGEKDFTKINASSYQLINPTLVSVEDAPATAIVLDVQTAELKQGESLTLTASNEPEGSVLPSAIVWSVEGNDKVTVENGVVTVAADAVVGSTATVKATAGTLEATCVITIVASDAIVAQTATLQYTGSTTGNMTATGNAANVGLDATLFTVDADKGETTNMPGLNKAHDIRLYSLKSAEATGHGSYFVVTIANGYTIQSINIDFKLNPQDAVIYAGSNVVTGTDGVYEINGSSFKVENGYKSDGSANTQVQINKIVITYIESSGETPVEIAQPIGNFSGYAISAADDSNIFTHIALATEKAYVEVGTILKTTTVYTFNKTNGLVTIDLGAYGIFTATYDEANAKLVNAGINGAAAAYLKNNNSIELTNAVKFWDCNGTTSELQAMFKRRYMSGSWQVDSSNNDRFVSYENGVAGSAMQRRGYGSGAVAVNLAADMEPVEVSNIGFWVYNSSANDITLRMWIYKGANLSNNAELGSVTAVAGQWTYCRMGFTKAAIYNFQIADFTNSGVALVFDNICLF